MTHSGRDLRLLAGAVFLSAVGDIVALFALALHVHGTTSSAAAVSALFATTLVPVIVLAPAAGLVADRVESVRVLVVASLAQAAVAAVLAFSGGLPATLALAVLLAAGSAFSQPAEAALVPAAAGPRPLAAANGLMESARYAGFAAGPLIAGALVAVGGIRLALLVNAASFLAIAVVGGLVRARRRPGPRSAIRPDRSRDGAVALWADRPLRIVVGACSASLLLVSAVLTLEVFYVKDVLRAGDAGYALVLAGWMAGMVIGAAGLARVVPAHLAGAGALLALAVQGAGLAGQVAWVALPASLAGYLVGGLGHGVKNALVRTLMHERIDAHLHGRAFAAYGAARNAAELAALGTGAVLATTVGPRLGLLVAGSAAVLAGLAGLGALRPPRLRMSLGPPMPTERP